MLRVILFISILVSFILTDRVYAGVKDDVQPIENLRKTSIDSDRNIITTKGQEHFSGLMSPIFSGGIGRSGQNDAGGHNCMVLIGDGGMIFDDLHGHVPEGQVQGWHHYSVLVPTGAGDVHIQNTLGIGDADLYTKGNAIPTNVDWDCRPYLVGNEEGCTVSNPNEGSDYYFSLNAYNTSYDGSDLSVHYNLPSSSQENRTEGFGWPGNTYSKDTMKHFMINVPDGLKDLVISTEGGSGDADLYLLKGIDNYIDASNNHDWSSSTNGNEEFISLSNPQPGGYTIGLYGHEDFADVHVKVRYKAYDLGAAAQDYIPAPSNPYAQGLNNGQWTQEFSDGATRYFQIYVPQGKNWLEVDALAYEGDMDMYVARERIPSTKDYDCRSVNSGLMVGSVDDGFGYDNNNSEECRLVAISAGIYYIMITSYKNRSYGQGYVMARYHGTAPKSGGGSSSAWTIQNACNTQGESPAYELLWNYAPEQTICVPSGNNSDSEIPYWFRLPSGYDNVTIKTDHGSGNGDLYLGDSSGWPTPNNNHSGSSNSSNRECISFTPSNEPSSSTPGIIFRGEHSGVTLRIMVDDPDGC